VRIYVSTFGLGFYPSTQTLLLTLGMADGYVV